MKGFSNCSSEERKGIWISYLRKVLLKYINSRKNHDQSEDDLKREPDLLQSHNDDEVPVESLEVNDS